MHILPVKKYFSLLITYLKPQWIRVSLMCVFLLANVGFQILNPQLLRSFVDTALEHGSAKLLFTISIGFVLVVLVGQGVAIIYSYFSESVAWTATNQLRADLVEHCLKLDMAFYQARTSGELIERIDGDITTLANFFSQLFVTILSNILVALAVLVLFFQIDLGAGMLMSVFALCWVAILVSIRYRALPFSLALRQKTAQFFGFLSEYLLGMEDFQANGATQFILNKFYMQRRDLLGAKVKSGVRSFLMANASYTLLVLGSVLALSIGIYLWSHRIVSIGTIYLMYAYIELLTMPINQIQLQLQSMQQAEACIQRVEELFQKRSSICDIGDILPPPGVLSVEFCNVSFAYTPSETVIHNVTFQIPPGNVLGIVGRTGSGKTTLIRLLFRFYDPQDGDVLLGGISLRKIPLHELRKRIGMVTQEVQLFHATIRDNLTFFDPSIGDTRILKALEQVGLLSWYQSLDQGLDTELGSDSQGISAGEAQLLALARIFLLDPNVVILDEASSRLDPITDELIQQAMQKLFVGRTVIVIAHRLETMRYVNEVLVLEQGRVIEHGPREQLVNDMSSFFAHLLQTSS